MKFFVFATVVTAVSAVPSLVNTGKSDVSRSEDGYGNYEFGYNEDHATGGTFRKEQGGPGFMSGSYGLRDIDGRVRTVKYIADALGYRASVSTNEPGTDVKQDPAEADFNNGDSGYSSPILSSPIVASNGYANSEANLRGYGGLQSLGNYEGTANLQNYGSLGGYENIQTLDNLKTGGELTNYGNLQAIGDLESTGKLQNYGNLEGLSGQAYNGQLLNNVHSDTYSTPVAFPSSYSVSTQHLSLPPVQYYQPAGSVLSGGDYSTNHAQIPAVLGDLGNGALNTLNKY